MAIVCNICKEEVKLISFGGGFVGVCCNKILYNSADKPQSDMKQTEKNDICMHLFHAERRSYQEKDS
ncbi:MAG TPA: hypothetical protein VMT12_03535 [Syntrophales bacterium]|nr:hypothetical protein [Syntrophales bacterium]